MPRRSAAPLLAVALVSAGCITKQPATDTATSITSPSPVSTTLQRDGQDGDRSGRSGVPSSGTTTTSATPPPAGTTGATTPVATPATITVAYQPDVKAVFDADCVRCHSGSRPDGNYAMTTYAEVMRAVVPGNARSALIVFTQRGGSMNRYLSGNAAAMADLVRTWIVNNAAAETR